jgi:UDP-glucuronate decarboxylase
MEESECRPLANESPVPNFGMGCQQNPQLSEKGFRNSWDWRRRVPIRQSFPTGGRSMLSLLAKYGMLGEQLVTQIQLGNLFASRSGGLTHVAGHKRILVAGGAGFLGSHLCERLVKDGNDVVCVDNFFTSQKTNVSHLLGNPNFELLRHDVIQPLWLEVDEIYNLACPAAPGHYQYNPIKTIKTSVIGAINLLGMAKRCRAKILQASTSEVYGDPEVHPQPETYRGAVNTLGPRACYDEGKRAAETLFMDYHRMNKVNIRIARIFNTYGPRMHPYDGRVVSNFIREALGGEDISIYGDGSQTRSFCYRDDLIEGLVRLMNAPDKCIGPINIGNPDEFTILELAQLVIELTGSKSKLVYKPPLPDDPAKRRPDITLARKNLDWEPHIKLRDGLKKTIEWFRSIDLSQFRAPTPNY